ncbi:MAG: FAD-dependent thymidylate synthase [Nanoarchaeota archaeon]|nr:FAD-dependent thymidylate synthase [Nanoarchaeota archaeon]
MFLGYTEDEKIVLSHFFTNLDKPVFFVKNMHPEVWALMQAMYSRSKKGLRQNFLELLKQDEENFKQLVEILKNKEAQIKMDNAINKAIKFMDKWVLGYGHSSVAEGAVVGIGLEGISILATKVIEDNRLSSFIEKSTRYVHFDRNSFYIDEKLKNSEFGEEVEKLINELFDFYEKLQEPVLEYVKKVAPLKEGQSEKAWERACAARRFDAVRYVLPACTKTSLGWTVNARELAHGIKKLLSHPINEMQVIGQMLKEEGKKVLPSLLKYADKNEYISETNKEMFELVKNYNFEEGDNVPVKLIAHSSDIDDLVVAAIIYRYSNAPMEKILEKVRRMSKEEKEKVFDKYLEKMGPHDWPMRELEHVYFTWDILMDFGAFRDLQRHRICTQTPQLTTTFHGYSVPKDIVDAGFKEEFDEIMQKADKLFRKIYEKYPYEAQYIVPLAFKKRYLMTANLREMYHIIKLRTTPQAHESYRNIVRQMYIILKEKFPLLTKYMVCNMSDEELGRLKAELRLEEKIKKGLI